MIADDVTNEKIKEVIENNKLKINEIMQEFHLNIFENIQEKQTVNILKVK